MIWREGVGTTARLNTSQGHGFISRLCLTDKRDTSHNDRCSPVRYPKIESNGLAVPSLWHDYFLPLAALFFVGCLKHLSRLSSVQIYWIECLVDIGLFIFSYTFWSPTHLGTTKGSVHVGMKTSCIIGIRYVNIWHSIWRICMLEQNYVRKLTFVLDSMNVGHLTNSRHTLFANLLTNHPKNQTYDCITSQLLFQPTTAKLCCQHNLNWPGPTKYFASKSRHLL
jgi:hypothetical protein